MGGMRKNRLETAIKTMTFTYYGHACFSVNTGEAKLLFDPFITPNPLASHIDIQTVEADAIFISHGHEDHLADTATIASRTGAPIISNWEIVSWFGKHGFQNGHPMNHGGAWNFPFGRVKYTTAIHSSGLPDGSYGGNPGGFAVQTATAAFYYSGDTALTKDMELLGEEYSLRFAVLPVGDNFTMGPQDALRAAKMLRVNKVIGVHFDTFPYIKIDRSAAVKHFADGGVELVLPEIGKSFAL